MPLEVPLSLPFLLLSDERRSAIAVLGIETVADGANVNVAQPIALAVDRDGPMLLTAPDALHPACVASGRAPRRLPLHRQRRSLGDGGHVAVGPPARPPRQSAWIVSA